MTQTEKARAKIIDLMGEPPCNGCISWDSQAHYCYRRSSHPGICKLTDAILALTDAEGNKLVVVPSKDQTIPHLPSEIVFGWPIHKRYAEQAQRDMLAAGFVRIEK